MIRLFYNSAAGILMACLLTLDSAQAIELSGVEVPEQATLENGTSLQLNGVGVREKFWFDIYVASLYVTQPKKQVLDILSLSGPMRIQMDFVYKEVESEKLLTAWKDGFEKNQNAERLQKLSSRIETFYSFFRENVVRGDRFQFDYLPDTGTRIIKNGTVLDTIQGEDFRNALIEIWLGNYPADQSLKEDMLGL